MNDKDRREFALYLQQCTNQQVMGVYVKERDADREDYARMAMDEATRRGLPLDGIEWNDDEDPKEPTPEEEDAFLSNVGHLGGLTRVTIGDEVVGTYHSEEEAIAALKREMDATEYWPNAWRIDDHGGHTLINLND